ncbi:hypothetical protein Lal_00042676, partial [Lupinus albus]
TTHKSTKEVKRSKLNNLSLEYEMFRMKPEEKILDLRKRFSHLINYPIALGKLPNNSLNLKFEKKSLSKLSLAALFGKLLQHKLELSQLEKYEEQEKMIKTISLKKAYSCDTLQDDEFDGDSTENMNMPVKKFNKFLRKN